MIGSMGGDDALWGRLRMNGIRVQFGVIQDVIGIPRSFDEFKFVPALIELNGNGFRIGFKLADLIGGRAPAVLVAPLKGKYDVSWVRARLPTAFGFTPEVSEVEKSLLNVGFIAVTADMTGIPFKCADYYGRTGIMFSPEGPDPALQQKVAEAFWQLLLLSPEDLSDFQAKVYHPGAGIWMHFGCSGGEPTFAQSSD